VAARAIVHASEHPERREYWVGATTAATIVANTVAPGLLDRYLGKTGFKSQQTDEPDDPNRPDNLWEPVPGDRGAHGRFDDRSHPKSIQWWATTHRGLLALGAAAAAAGVALLTRNRE
jgi:hypothetical protein